MVLFQAKHLQFVSGVHTTSFWLANFLWDALIILTVITLSIVIVVAFQVDAYSAGEGLGAVVLLLVTLHITDTLGLCPQQLTCLHVLYRYSLVLQVYPSLIFLHTSLPTTSLLLQSSSCTISSYQ